MQQRRKQPTITGIAWFTPEQYELLLEYAADRDQLPNTYEEWLQKATDLLHFLHSKKYIVPKIDLDVHEVVAWCKQLNIPFNSKARAQFTAERVRQLNQPPA